MSGTTSTMAGPLEAALKRGAPSLGVEKVVSVERFTSGLSSQSYQVDAETGEGPARWVMRIEPEFGVIPPYDIAREYRLLCEMSEAGLRVPQMLHLEEDASVVGGRFMLMSFVEGEIYQSMDPRLTEAPELLAKIQEQFVQTLVKIHATKQTVLPSYANGRDAARGEIAVCRKRLLRTEMVPAPVLRHALDVLDEHAPEAERITLLHGDYRLPNLKWNGAEISGILDWELARVGDPLSDLGFSQTVGHGHCSIENELADRYGELAGIEVDPKKIQYYRFLEMVKGSIIGHAGAYDLANGGDDLRLMSVTTIAAAGQAMMGVLEAQLGAFLEA
jgi:aminoglycoside phosphotransferase (APT) family kinase protein